MKYMGSKAALLQGPLGDLVLTEAAKSDRFVDLFSGSGSVGNAVAEQLSVPVLSADLQRYSQLLSAVIIERTESLAGSPQLVTWLEDARAAVQADVTYANAGAVRASLTKQDVISARALSAARQETGFITEHYGGHYFSPRQAIGLDTLFQTMPQDGPTRTLAYASMIRAASICAAAPGHTAQPFQPTPTLLPFIQKAWSRDIFAEIERGIESLGGRHALVKGRAIVSGAQELAAELESGDLVFCDPPYSSVQYSRFYHVLEGIARGGWAEVAGAGRAPALADRSSSTFSLRGAASTSLRELLRTLRARECQVIVTFPNAEASNGLSSDSIVAIASEAWHVTTTLVESTHSTLGGRADATGRGARKKLKEAVMVLRPRSDIVFVAGDSGRAPRASVSQQAEYRTH